MYEWKPWLQERANSEIIGDYSTKIYRIHDRTVKYTGFCDLPSSAGTIALYYEETCCSPDKALKFTPPKIELYEAHSTESTESNMKLSRRTSYMTKSRITMDSTHKLDSIKCSRITFDPNLNEDFLCAQTFSKQRSNPSFRSQTKTRGSTNIPLQPALEEGKRCETAQKMFKRRYTEVGLENISPNRDLAMVQKKDLPTQCTFGAAIEKDCKKLMQILSGLEGKRTKATLAAAFRKIQLHSRKKEVIKMVHDGMKLSKIY